MASEYGTAVVALDEPIPAHLLGNMWSQSWGNLSETVGPSESRPGYDLTRLLLANGLDEIGMVRYGERFFSSLGFEPLPQTFWDRSLSYVRRTGTSSATRAHGTSTLSRMFASRCARA